MTEANESADITVEEEVVAAPEMSTVERAEMLLNQDEAIFKRGINPYPVNLDVTTTIDAVRVKYDGKLEAGAETDDIVGVAGRVLFIRNAGGLCFVQLAAGDGTTIQAMLSKKQIGADSLKQFKQLVDLGDHLFVKGRVIASKTGELSIFADEWAIAAKALQPLPTLHKELNEDTRTRKPYIGMIADEKIRNMVRNRSRAVASLRRTFDEHGFLEVETPMLQTIHGGAAARPFTTHMNAFDLDLYLRIAPELFLKRCLVGGIEKVFEINRDFRNEGVDATHAPEFTMVEAYEAYGNYDTIAKLVKELIQKTAIDVFGSTKVTLLDGTEYDFGGEWKTMSMYDSLSEALGQQITPETSVEELGAIADRLGVERDEVENHGKLVEHLWDLYVRGFELATGYSELNDPIVQRERFVAQAKDALAGDEEACDIDEDFLEALGVGMPPAGGMGMGIDRLLIALTGATIRETITFPLVKPLNN